MMKRKWDDDVFPSLADHLDVPLADYLDVSLADHLDIPLSKQEEIREHHQSVKEQNASFSSYCISSLPGFSWARFAGVLYYHEEEAALVTAKRYIKREEGMLYVLTELMLSS